MARTQMLVALAILALAILALAILALAILALAILERATGAVKGRVAGRRVLVKVAERSYRRSTYRVRLVGASSKRELLED